MKSIKIKCPFCGKEVEMKLELHGENRLGVCPNCNEISSFGENSGGVSNWKSLFTMMILIIGKII